MKPHLLLVIAHLLLLTPFELLELSLPISRNIRRAGTTVRSVDVSPRWFRMRWLLKGSKGFVMGLRKTMVMKGIHVLGV